MEEIAEVYAHALFEVAKEHGELAEIREQLGQFAKALNDNRQLAVFFFSPYFSTEEKKDGFQRAVEDADPAFMNFLEALIERHRMPVIFLIRDRYERLWDEEEKVLPVEITSAIDLEKSTVAEDRGADPGADRAQGRDVQQGRSGHHRRDRAARRQLHPRRVDPNRLNQLRKQVAQA